jgi:cell division protein FtsW (lipid II flippase)
MLYMRHAEVGVAGLAAYLLLHLARLPHCDPPLGGSSICFVWCCWCWCRGRRGRMGAQRWLFGIQPSEPAKLGVVMLLAGSTAGVTSSGEPSCFF